MLNIFYIKSACNVAKVGFPNAVLEEGKKIYSNPKLKLFDLDSLSLFSSQNSYVSSKCNVQISYRYIRLFFTSKNIEKLSGYILKIAERRKCNQPISVPVYCFLTFTVTSKKNIVFQDAVNEKKFSRNELNNFFFTFCLF